METEGIPDCFRKCAFEGSVDWKENGVVLATDATTMTVDFTLPSQLISAEKTQILIGVELQWLSEAADKQFSAKVNDQEVPCSLIDTTD